MPSFIKNLSGGKVISGGALSPRGRRGNTGQVAAYWSGGGGGNPPPTVEYLVIAGGGSSGYSGGGGGAGGYRNSTSGEATGGGGSAESVFTVSAGTLYTVTIGTGGPGYPMGDGTNSVFGSITSTGGGKGGHDAGGFVHTAGSPGGSGGGGGFGMGGGARTASPVQGNNGGSNRATGGGAGASGSTGAASSITGTSVTRATGLCCEGNGEVNKGDGGGQAGGWGGSGSSGIVIIRYLLSFDPAVVTGSPTLTTSGSYRIYQFTGSGTITF